MFIYAIAAFAQVFHSLSSVGMIAAVPDLKHKAHQESQRLTKGCDNHNDITVTTPDLLFVLSAPMPQDLVTP